MLNPTTILRAIADMDKPGTAQGRALFLGRRNSMGGALHTPAQVKFAEDLGKLSRPVPVVHHHPEGRGAALAQINLTSTGRGDGPLTPTEATWINTLPTDPAAVPYEDAELLATLAHTVHRRHVVDRRLIDSHWQPVKAIHDVKAAEATLANAQYFAAIPASATHALADAIADQHSQLQPHEAIARASEMLNTAGAQRRAAHERVIAQARDTITKVKNREAQRLSPTR